MAELQSWKYGFNSYGNKPDSQLNLNYTDCCMSDPYLIRNCGGCNPECSFLLGKATSCDADLGISPVYPKFGDALANIGGLQWDNIQGRAVDTTSFPSEINLVWNNRATIPPEIKQPLAISPKEVFPSHNIVKGLGCIPVVDVRKKLGLPDTTRLWLSSGAIDPIIDWMWTNPVEVINAININRLEVLISPDFSTYGEQCPVSWRVSGKKSLILYSEWAQLFPASILTISMPNLFFVEQWAEWFNKNITTNCVSVNAQTWKSEKLFDSMFDLVGEFRSLVNRELHYIVSGPTTIVRIEKVRSILPNVTIVSSLHYNAR